MRSTSSMIRLYELVPIAAVGIGLLLPGVGQTFAAHATILMAGIFFLSALRLDLTQVLAEVRQMWFLLGEASLMLIVFPLLIYPLAVVLTPTLAIPLFLLAAMPVGMTAPLLSELAGGRKQLALLLTIITSLLAPLTIPLVMRLVIGVALPIDYVAMGATLFAAVFAPIAVASLVKRYCSSLVEVSAPFVKPSAVVLLALLIAGSVARQADAIISSLATGQAWGILGVLTITFALYHIIGYFAPFWRDRADRVTSSVCVTYMNFTLAIYIADEYFATPEVMVPLALAVIPWTLMSTPFQIIMTRKRTRTSPRRGT